MLLNFKKSRNIHSFVFCFAEIKNNFTLERNTDYLLIKKCKNMATLKNFSPREAYAAYMRGSMLVDVRDSNSVKVKNPDVKQVVKLPFSEFYQRYGELPTNRPVVLVSGIGNKGKEAAKFLLTQGYEDVAIMTGGMAAWEQEGLPVRERTK